MKIKLSLNIILSCLLFAYAGVAVGSIKAEAKKQLPIINKLANNQSVIAAVKSSNKQHLNLSKKQVRKLDRTWRKQLSQSSKPLVNSVVNSKLAQRLRQSVKLSKGHVQKMLILDQQGLSVAQSTAFSRYWYGGLAIWKNTMKTKTAYAGYGKVNKQTQMRAASIAVPIFDDKQIIGVIAAYVNLPAK